MHSVQSNTEISPPWINTEEDSNHKSYEMLARSQSPNVTRSDNLNISWGEQTLSELHDLQKEFHRMELNRRQKVNSIKIKRSKQLQYEYKLKIKHDHVQKVKKRRASFESIKSAEKLQMVAAKHEKRRQSRSRNRHYSFIQTNSRSSDQRRESVLQRKLLIQQQKEQEKKKKFLQKQRLREQKIARVKNKRQSEKSVRPKSAFNSFCVTDSNVNKARTGSFSVFIDDYSEDTIDTITDSESLLLFENNPHKKSKTHKMRSMSAQNLKLSSSHSNNVKPRNALKQLSYHSGHSNRNKRKVRRFMKPTLSAYLLTNNPGKLLASC